MRASLLSVLLAASAAAAARDEIVLEPDRDNTLFSNDATLSNGAGQGVFSGLTRFSGVRRALLRFDLSALPAGAQVTGASLQLNCTRSISQNTPFTIHRLTADWGEAGSDAGDPGGSGAPAEPGDATWSHRFFGSAMWTSPGGDFVAAASSSTSIGQEGVYVFPGLAGDVQFWQANAGANFGWIVIGDEVDSATAKRFGSRENTDPTLRPKLTIVFDMPSCTGDLNGDGVVDLTDLATLLAHFGTPSGALFEDGDLDGNGTVDLTDLATLLGNFGATC
ncbi:MAG: DNRLRE domain-containing protein [Phycisphaerales bacterium]|nr:DNRLRE domain-containing protein [Phycisphaerales bacterium]